MQKIEHIGIAVSDIKRSNELFERLLGVAPYKEESVESEKVTTSFFRQGGNKIELIQDIGDGSTINSFIAKRGEGVHHIAFAVSDIKAEMARLKSEGFRLLSDEPKRGADNKWICFVHPKTANGILIELTQEISDKDLG